MKALSLLALLASLTVVQGATTYTDATGENHDGNGHMDITSVDVDSTSTTATFTLNLGGLLIFPSDWGKYGVGISTDSTTDDTGSPVGNPWARNVNMADGMDAWIGSWVDGATGAQAFTYGGWRRQLDPELGDRSHHFDDSVSFTFGGVHDEGVRRAW